jgi:hypothetical protein
MGDKLAFLDKIIGVDDIEIDADGNMLCKV